MGHLNTSQAVYMKKEKSIHPNTSPTILTEKGTHSQPIKMEKGKSWSSECFSTQFYKERKEPILWTLLNKALLRKGVQAICKEKGESGFLNTSQPVPMEKEAGKLNTSQPVSTEKGKRGSSNHFSTHLNWPVSQPGPALPTFWPAARGQAHMKALHWHTLK